MSSNFLWVQSIFIFLNENFSLHHITSGFSFLHNLSRVVLISRTLSKINYLSTSNLPFAPQIPQVCLFWSNLEWFAGYSILDICLWNPKEQRRSRKSSNVANSATNLILVCCVIRIQFTKSTVWPRNAEIFMSYQYWSRCRRPKVTGFMGAPHQIQNHCHGSD